MSQELFSAVSGASAAWSQLDIVSHNLANVGTVGYKARQTTFQLSEGANNNAVLGQAYVEPGESPIDHSNGALQLTDNPLDIAIQGRGFFTVATPDGEQFLTRNGSFQLDTEGYVATMAGDRLQTTAGPILLQQGQRLEIGDDARVTIMNDVDGTESEIGWLQILDGEVEPVGATMFKAVGPMEELAQYQMQPGEAPPMQIRQRHLEKSNVDPLGAMVELIEASRYIEAYRKMMQASDEADSRLVQTGRT